MKQEKFSLCIGKVTDGTKLERRNTQTLKTYVTNHVCEKCNHGWMSALEGWFLKTVGLLVEPTWPQLANSVFEQVTKENNVLARWLLKTAVTAEQNSLVKQQIIPDWVRPLAKTGKLTADFWVDLGFSKERTVALVLAKGFPMLNGNQYFPMQFHKDGFSFTLQLNHLLLRIIHAPQAEPMRIFSMAIQPVLNTPEKAYLEFENFRSFDQSLVLRTWLKKK